MLFSKATRKATGRLGIGPHKFLAPSPCSVHWQWWLCADELPLHSAEQSTCYLGWMQLLQWLMKKKKILRGLQGFQEMQPPEDLWWLFLGKCECGSAGHAWALLWHHAQWMACVQPGAGWDGLRDAGSAPWHLEMQPAVRENLHKLWTSVGTLTSGCTLTCVNLVVLPLQRASQIA